MAEAITFSSKNKIECPVCGTLFNREDLLTGRGRLNAGDLTDELRRTYLPTKKYGKINPLLYPITVCPNCLYSAEKDDFSQLSPKKVDEVRQFQDVRAKYLVKIFGIVSNFNEKRDLIAGVSSYILALSCYSFFDSKRQSPTIKMGIYSLRAAWLMNDLFEESGEHQYQELKEIFYRKATEFYQDALKKQSNGEEPLDGVRWLGPDTDKNYGYDGFLYENAILKYKTLMYIEDPFEKLAVYEDIKRTLSKVFGIGKKARNKPEVLLNFSRNIFDKLGTEVEELKMSLESLEIESMEGGK